MLQSPSPKAMSLSTPQASTPIPPTFIPLLDAIETRIQLSPSHSPVKEIALPHVTESEQTQFANPQPTKEDIPLEFQETLGGSSSETATTTGEPIGFQLDSGFIYKTSLKATTVEATIVTSVLVGSPQYKDKGAFGFDDMENSPIIKPNTTTSGRDSDDPIKLGDELRYKELAERMSSMESSMAEMKDMMRQMMEHSHNQPTTQQIANEMWKSVPPIIQAKRNLADINHNTHMELTRNMVEATYKVTQADIKAIREHLVKTTGSTPSTVLQDEDDDDAKKGENDKLRKLQPFSQAKPKVQEKPESAQTKSSAKASEAGKQKGIDETLNK
ncbi:hypothetical protein HanRHA438_Chr03g0105531 [Helianthus annuus]|nr:hypothetical protein HanIR_Chr03g0102991 [Helianthus annuus]KAJ0772808.1 hypothetical protein HanOQP8_Chr03g0091641 [Helianthus annuus]KAJ0934272.1 hypothetical protein HanRHA438_Chr03g0105531 [Helianthus annuus]KAJ0942336.1 hypothetical protein HanPSC8_Chr03g0090771 [Helianthus annuus]